MKCNVEPIKTKNIPRTRKRKWYGDGERIRKPNNVLYFNIECNKKSNNKKSWVEGYTVLQNMDEFMFSSNNYIFTTASWTLDKGLNTTDQPKTPYIFW